ncbi:hypothetical protein C672_3604 [[Clostridium] bifermentans ATCC 638]|uniref:Uncharacterized protein n=1 Tax=Paraclostridium bifermentans ATCC 638 = DSM 14991 TaxID=1233171 RepID=T4VE94_PARBF|nr:hypothetical protein [Paraclostridium bifermentans]EQK39823.1 hypothetical protein C672_3604 [[Clostridium] bifermentans ATCC 638] [Paraclostridium bifermentans ATCC 638 = DSM 14991]RIZ57429.1 hypothetical protein CHH45_16460 [Paraclostridium bifermentans]
MKNIMCQCGNEAERDGYSNIEIEDGFICIKGYAYCECGNSYKFEDLYKVDFDKPFDTIIE